LSEYRSGSVRLGIKTVGGGGWTMQLEIDLPRFSTDRA